MFYRGGLRRPVIGLVVLHVIDYFSRVSVAVVQVFVLLRLDLGPVLPAAARMDDFLVEVVVVVLIEVSVGHLEERT